MGKPEALLRSAEAFGADATFTKPIDLVDLLNEVARLLHAA